ncbi:MAG TPA: RidA family protein [Gaiellaceae bacterium]|nr:RidA family protein [Gaiellaceae bacterium]
MGLIEERLADLGIELPPSFTPIANFDVTARTGSLLYVSGHGPTQGSEIVFSGHVTSEVSLEEAYRAARLSALNCLRSMQDGLGSLDRVRRIVKVVGMVWSDPDFTGQPQVVNGASDLLVEVFGERGRHARSAVGTAGLPLGIPVEIEMVVEVD